VATDPDALDTASSDQVGPAASGPIPASPQQPSPEVYSRFSHLRLGDQLIRALDALNIQEPTEIQNLAVPAIMRGGDHMMASHTGSGKTLAYLLPIVEELKRAEREEGFVARPKRPRVLIVGPTKELTEQIKDVAKALCHFAKFRVTCLNSPQRRSLQLSKLMGPIDVVVSTPTRLLQSYKEGHLYFTDVRHLVVDEADTIFAEGWGTELEDILKPLRSRPTPLQTILVSATMAKPIKRLLATQFPDMNMLETASLHKGITGSQHEFVSQQAGRDRLDLLSEVMSPYLARGKKLLVFCNSVDSSRAVEYFCREQGMPAVCYNGEMTVAARQESMERFSGAAARPVNGQESGVSKEKQPVMIATDVAARGLDFTGHVDLVINFDFPYTAVDYIHRSGRTARAGRTGHVVSLVGKHDRTLAQRIEWALDHGEPLDQLSSDPKILPPSQRRLPSKDSRPPTLKALRQQEQQQKQAARRYPSAKEARRAAQGAGPRGTTGYGLPNKGAEDSKGSTSSSSSSNSGTSPAGYSSSSSHRRSSSSSSSIGRSSVGGKGGARKAGIRLSAGPKRGAARVELMQERLQQQNQQKASSKKGKRRGKK